MAESKLVELVARPLCLYNESCLYIFICTSIVNITGMFKPILSFINPEWRGGEAVKTSGKEKCLWWAFFVLFAQFFFYNLE